MLMSEYVYCVTITFKLTEQIEQQICIKFYIKCEHPPWKLLDDSEGHSYGQMVIGIFIMTMH